MILQDSKEKYGLTARERKYLYLYFSSRESFKQTTTNPLKKMVGAVVAACPLLNIKGWNKN